MCEGREIEDCQATISQADLDRHRCEITKQYCACVVRPTMRERLRAAFEKTLSMRALRPIMPKIPHIQNATDRRDEDSTVY